MWVNAQRDGRPAEYRWRPLFKLQRRKVNLAQDLDAKGILYLAKFRYRARTAENLLVHQPSRRPNIVQSLVGFR